MESLRSLLSHMQALIESGQSYVLLLPIYVSLLLGERIGHALTQPRPWNNRDAAANIAITIAFMLRDVAIAAIIPVAIMALVYEHASLHMLPAGGWGWAAAFLLYDFIWYVEHRLGHKVGFFWALHSVHHSSQEYNMTVASRGSIFDILLGRPVIYLMPLLGVSPTQFVTVQIVTNVWGIAQHTRLVGKLGWLDWLIATPSNHRVHHGSDLPYLDRNYGEILMIWDHLFGTYTPEDAEPNYGLTTNIHTYNPLRIQAAGFAWLWSQMRSADSLWHALQYLWKPPGWRHDGSGQTTEQMQAAGH